MVGLAAAFNMVACQEEGPPEPIPFSESGECTLVDTQIRDVEPVFKRGLTQGEAQFYGTFFGKNIDLTDACVYLYDQTPTDTPRITSDVVEGDTKIISVYGRKYYSPDYSLENDAYLAGAFAYEMTHLMQHQKGTHENEPDASVSSEFDKLYGRIDLDLYTEAQQRAIVADYVRYFLNSRHDTRYLDHTTSNLEGLRQIVEEQFPMAKVTREYFEEHGQLPDLQTVQGWLTDCPAFAAGEEATPLHNKAAVQPRIP